MGYELNIIRKSNWADNKEESNITLDEWLSYGRYDPGLKLNEKEDIGFFEWIAYPESDAIGFPWFSYNKGYIYTKNPNFLIIQKLLTIAQALNAKVFGEGGEEYDERFFDSFT
jgi:hypothetical protein